MHIGLGLLISGLGSVKTGNYILPGVPGRMMQ
jgi:hypothetical protein